MRSSGEPNIDSPVMSHIVPRMAYTKLFNSIVTSTIWTEDDRTRIVWITMLAIADKNGEVQGSIPGLARIAGVPVDDCRAAIRKFLSPDPDSRTKDDEGRRIEEIDGGWHLLNFRKYREMASKEDLQAAEASRKARYRARIARNVPKCPGHVPGVSTVNTHIAEAYSDSDSEADTNTDPKGNTEKRAREAQPPKAKTGFKPPTQAEMELHAAKIGLPTSEIEAFFAHHEARGWMLPPSYKVQIKSWSHAMVTWRNNARKFAVNGFGSHRQTEAERRRDAADPAKNGGVSDDPDAPIPY